MLVNTHNNDREASLNDRAADDQDKDKDKEKEGEERRQFAG